MLFCAIFISTTASDIVERFVRLHRLHRCKTDSVLKLPLLCLVIKEAQAIDPGGGHCVGEVDNAPPCPT